MTERPSEQIRHHQEHRWRSVIRIFAVTMALLGLMLIAFEVMENIWGAEEKIHLSKMIWGVILLSFGMLVIQKGDVSASLDELVDRGTEVRGWWPLWGRRAYDNAPVPPVTPPVPPNPPTKEEG